jgi:hypothetical protein
MSVQRSSPSSETLRNDDQSQNIEQKARLNRITSLRGAGTTHKPAASFLCIPTKLADDERWTNAILCSGFARAAQHVSEPTFEHFLDKVVDGFSSAFHQPQSTEYNELYSSSSSLFDAQSQLHSFYTRKAAEPLRGVARVSRRQPSKTVIVVDDHPQQVVKPRGTKNLVDSSVASWGQHMESLANTQNSSLDDLRRSQTVATRQADDFNLLNSARESEHNELLRLEAVAQKHEDRRDMRKRERD